MEIQKKQSLMNVICLGLFSSLIVKNIMYPDLQEMLIYTYTLEVYFIVDIIWLYMWPKCNPCAYEVIFHHIATIIALALPIWNPEARHFAAKVQLIELTTWLSHLRRLLKPKKFYVLDATFYTSLLVVRHIWFPYLLYFVLSQWTEAFPIKYWLPSALFLAYLNITYINWTVLLFRALAKKKDDLD